MNLLTLSCTIAAARRNPRRAAAVASERGPGETVCPGDHRRRSPDDPLAGNRRRGFTLVELLLVAAILSVLAAIAAPRYANSLTRYRVEAAAQRIVVDLAAARTAARAQSATVTIRFGAGGYEIDGMKGIDGANAYRVNLREAPYNIRSVSHDFDGFDDISYDGYGFLNRGGVVVVQLSDLERRIIIDEQTGQARVEP